MSAALPGAVGMGIGYTDWMGCYGSSWRGTIVPESFAHPAKFSRVLIRRIYEYAFQCGWFKGGDTILDPFAGVALGALHAMQRGCHWVGVELEERFVGWGQQNIDLWNDHYAEHLPGWGTATIVQGDSRQLVDVVREAGGCVPSPPYADQAIADRQGFECRPSERPLAKDAKVAVVGYSGRPANLGNLRADGGVSSPPYAASLASDDPDRRGGLYRDPKRRGDRTLTAEYGGTEGQLGQERAETFWSAARRIVEQTYRVLAPGAYTLWVTKRFVRDKKIVEFSQRWHQLCRACGFEHVEWIRAWRTEERGNVTALFDFDVMVEDDAGLLRTGRAVKAGERMRYEDKKVKESEIEWKGFFRRTHEGKGSPRIDWEDVLVLRRPL